MVLLKGRFRFTKEKLTNIFVFLGLLFATVRMIRGIDNLYVLALLSFCGIFFLNYKKLYEPDFKKLLMWFLPFGIWASLSAIWSLEPLISFSRGLFYIFISSTAVLIGFIYKNKTRVLFKQFLIINGLIVVISFLSLISGIPSDAWTANHGLGFTSIFIHQNTLAAVLMFTLIGPVYFLINCLPASLLGRVIPDSNTESKKGSLSHSSFEMTKKIGVISNPFRVRNLILKWESIFSLLLILSNLYFIYLSYSRAVMLALFIGGLTFIYLLGTVKFNLIFTLFLIISGASVFYFFGNNINTYLKKGGSDYFARRNILWEPSYKAALNGGIIGLGYGVTDPTIESNYKKENRFGELKREKGNSILALVEETGIIGLVLFLLPVVKVTLSFINNFKQSGIRNQITVKSNSSLITHHGAQVLHQTPITKNSSLITLYSSLVFAFLLSFIIHSQFEGWFVGISSFYLIVFVTMLSSLIARSYVSSVLSNQ